MWNRSSPMSSTAFLCKIRQVTFLLSSPGLMSPLISKFWAGGLLSRLFLQLLEAADSSGYLSFQKKKENLPSVLACFPPFTTFSPFQRVLSLESLDNVLTQGNTTVFEESLCESGWDFVPPVLPAPHTLHHSFFTGEVLLLLLRLAQSICTVHLSARALHMLWPGAASEEQGYVTAIRNIHLPLELPLLGASSWSAAAAGWSRGPNAPQQAEAAASAKENNLLVAP